MPVCSAHHTPLPSDTVVRRANGTVAVPAPLLMVAVVEVDDRAENDTTAATLVAAVVRAVPAATLKHGNTTNAPFVERDGMPSWSYNQVDVEYADSEHALEPDTICDCIGADCPAVIEYSSTYTD